MFKGRAGVRLPGDLANRCSDEGLTLEATASESFMVAI